MMQSWNDVSLRPKSSVCAKQEKGNKKEEAHTPSRTDEFGSKKGEGLEDGALEHPLDYQQG